MYKKAHSSNTDVRKALSNWRRLLACFAAVVALAGHGAAQADVWAYTDAKGVVHFAAEKIDDRYELFFKDGTGFDARVRAEVAAAPDADAPKAAAPAAAATAPVGKSKLVTFFEVSPSFKAVRHHMRDAAQAYNVEFELLQAVIAAESGYDTNAVSPKGAVGLMQLIPPTAQRYGVTGDANTPIEKKLTDPKTNIHAGTRYLRDLIKMFPGKLELAVAAYNAGEGAVQRYGNKIPPFKETQNYVLTVMQIYNQLKPPAGIVQRQQLGQQSARVRAEFPGPDPAAVPAAPGRIAGRGNMVPPITAAPVNANMSATTPRTPESK
jgi:soluble lytic murein transglycosylase-like protein